MCGQHVLPIYEYTYMLAAVRTYADMHLYIYVRTAASMALPMTLARRPRARQPRQPCQGETPQHL